MQLATLALEYLRVLLSAAPVVGVVVLLFFLTFKAEIRALINRIATIRFPGGELSTTQLERSRQVDADPTLAPPPPAADPASLPPQLNLTPDQKRRIIEFFQAERARAALWEYRFLNNFLVPHTQLVLNWLANLGQRTTVQLYDSFWIPLIPDPKERFAVLNALRAHHLVELQGDLLEVTPKGKEYLRWRGPLPPPSNPPLSPAIGTAGTSPPATTDGAVRG